MCMSKITQMVNSRNKTRNHICHYLSYFSLISHRILKHFIHDNNLTFTTIKWCRSLDYSHLTYEKVSRGLSDLSKVTQLLTGRTEWNRQTYSVSHIPSFFITLYLHENILVSYNNRPQKSDVTLVLLPSVVYQFRWTYCSLLPSHVLPASLVSYSWYNCNCLYHTFYPYTTGSWI